MGGENDDFFDHRVSSCHNSCVSKKNLGEVELSSLQIGPLNIYNAGAYVLREIN